MFNAISVTNDGTYTAQFVQLDNDALMEGDVKVKVEYSTMNYKDALAITGASPVVRHFPMVPGIDFAGVVVESQSDKFQVGDKVLLNGWGVGEVHWGGYSEVARVKSKWLQPIPAGLSSRDAMGLGTAGYTAMLCVQALERHGITPDKGDILVSGAMGGVGSVAIHLLAQRGYQVYALTGRPENQDYLTQLGAKGIVARDQYSDKGKPLQKERWAGAVDVVGSHTLANICASIQYGGAVAACGLAQGADLPATVMPFILRGVALLGVDSVYQPMATRTQAWEALAQETNSALIDSMTTEISLAETLEYAQPLLAGKVQGRLLVKVTD